MTDLVGRGEEYAALVFPLALQGLEVELQVFQLEGYVLLGFVGDRVGDLLDVAEGERDGPDDLVLHGEVGDDAVAGQVLLGEDLPDGRDHGGVAVLGVEVDVLVIEGLELEIPEPGLHGHELYGMRPDVNGGDILEQGNHPAVFILRTSNINSACRGCNTAVIFTRASSKSAVAMILKIWDFTVSRSSIVCR